MSNIISKKELEKMLSLSISTITRMEKRGEFPRRRQFGVGRVGWILSEIEQWVAERPIVHTMSKPIERKRRINIPQRLYSRE
jgi:prophage regulatory protein